MGRTFSPRGFYHYCRRLSYGYLLAVRGSQLGETQQTKTASRDVKTIKNTCTQQQQKLLTSDLLV